MFYLPNFSASKLLPPYIATYFATTLGQPWILANIRTYRFEDRIPVSRLKSDSLTGRFLLGSFRGNIIIRFLPNMFQRRIFHGWRNRDGHPRDRVHRNVRGHQRGRERLRTTHYSRIGGPYDRAQRGNGSRR